MYRRALLMGTMLALAACASAPSVSEVAKSEGIVGVLTNQLGLTETQAQGGVGAYLTLAQEKLSAGDFDQVAKLVPGASKYMDQAKSLGAVTGPLKNAAGLDQALGNLGLNQEAAWKFVPTVTDYLSNAGGATTKNLLAGVME